MKGQESGPASLILTKKKLLKQSSLSRSLVSVLVFIQFRVDRKAQRIVLLQLRYHKENIYHVPIFLPILFEN